MLRFFVRSDTAAALLFQASLALRRRPSQLVRQTDLVMFLRNLLLACVFEERLLPGYGLTVAVQRSYQCLFRLLLAQEVLNQFRSRR